MSKKKHPKKTLYPIDYPSVLERLGGDESFLKELLDLFRVDFSERYRQLQKAIEGENFNQIKELGHTLKGSSANLSLTFLQEVSSKMETAGREDNIEKAKDALALLEEGFKRLEDFLSESKTQSPKKNQVIK